MRMRREIFLSIFLILYVSSHTQVMAGWMPKVFSVRHVAKWGEIVKNHLSSGRKVKSALNGADFGTCYNDKRYANGVTVHTVGRISDISTELAKAEEIFGTRQATFEEKIRNSEAAVDLNLVMFELIESMNVIDGIYKELINRLSGDAAQSLDIQNLCSFAHEQVYSDPLLTKVDAFYKNVVEEKQLSKVAQKLQEIESQIGIVCGTGHSPFDYLQAVYNSIILVEMKAFLLTAFSHNHLFNHNGTGKCEYRGKDSASAIDLEHNHLHNRLKLYNEEFLKEINKLSRKFRSCDSESEFIRDKTYYELEGAVQLIVYYPVSPNGSYVDAKKTQTCDSIVENGTPKMYCSDEKFCTTSKARNCLGWSMYCRTVPWIKGCLSEKPPRRYQWLVWNESKRPSARFVDLQCPEHLKMDSSDPNIQPCICECNDIHHNSISTHLFNMQWVESDISHNKVLTGVRFLVEHRVMQFQIQHGVLGSHFTVEKPEWKPVNDISEEIYAKRSGRKLNGDFSEVSINADYIYIATGSNSAINFDTLEVPDSHVLTGIKFTYTQDPGRYPPWGISIALKARKFDHTTGELCKDCEPMIIESTEKHPNEHKYPTKNVNVPKYPTKPSTSPGSYAYIKTSDRLYDGGQTTLPLFDALSVFSNPPTALGGIGIYHKSNDDFTGFISLKLLSLNYTMYLSDDTSAPEIEDKYISGSRERSVLDDESKYLLQDD